MFKPESSIRLAGLENFIELITSHQFLQFFGNTLFFMMGIPVSVAASLTAAILLSKDTRAGGGRVYLWLIAAAGLVVSTMILVALGMGGTAMTLLLVGIASFILMGGVFGGLTFYRTVFYTPHFVAGVATFILWKKLYSKDTGPVNAGLQPVLDQLAVTVNAVPSPMISGLLFVGYVLIALLFVWGLGKLRQMYVDGDLGWGAASLPVGLLLLPGVIAWVWSFTSPTAIWLTLMLIAAAVYQGSRLAMTKGKFATFAANGFGSALVLSLLAMVGQFVLLGLSAVMFNLPAMAADNGLEAPGWITTTQWSKPALMIMGFWGAIGSNNMLLYLAALTNVPGELYEAADIDGATPMQRFWNVTWPQLAPTTFFIFVMSVIGGLQGGFEMARVMTQGGPAGSTTTLAYFIYIEGFETGRLGYASAVAWALFVLVFSVTLFNWKFGNKYVND
jgi:multiple sugar transport system permease protein